MLYCYSWFGYLFMAFEEHMCIVNYEYVDFSLRIASRLGYSIVSSLCVMFVVFSFE